MMENNIPTAETFFLEEARKLKSDTNDIPEWMIESAKEFAKLHCEAQLKAILNNATVTVIDHEEISEGSFTHIWGVDDDSIKKKRLRFK